MSKTLDQYTQQLRRLLDDAKKAMQDGDTTAVDDAFSAFDAFIVDSDNAINGVAELDAVARQAMRDITVADISNNVAAIASRTAEVAALQKRFSTIAGANNSIAANLRLEKVRDLLNSSTQTIASLRALAETLPTATDADAKKIAQQIDDVIGGLSKLGAAVQTKL